jgi:hypothetical protein
MSDLGERRRAGDVPAGRAVAAFDSASGFLRATARGLRGEDFNRLGQGWLAGAGARLTGLLPAGPRRTVYTTLGAREGLPPERLGGVDGASLGDWVVDHYDAAEPYPVVFLGSSNGALVHLCVALGAPWLPQTLLVPVRWPDNDPDRPDAARRFGARVAPPLLDRNPDLALHHMHDGNQDRLMVDKMAYFRLKRLALGEAYRRFLTERLRPGAPIVLVDDRSSWPTSTVADRHVFQTGARGGLRPEDYQRTQPAPPPDGDSPEAEWGFDDRLADDLRGWAAEHGHPVHRLELAEPEALSPVVAELARRRHGASRLLVEQFLMLDPVQADRAGAAPFWTVFGVRSSAAALGRYLDAADPYDDIDVLLFSHGVRSAGLADAASWQRLADRARHRGRLLAVNPRRYPADFASLARFVPELRRLPAATTPSRPLTLADLAAETTRWPGVTWHAADHPADSDPGTAARR